MSVADGRGEDDQAEEDDEQWKALVKGKGKKSKGKGKDKKGKESYDSKGKKGEGKGKLKKGVAVAEEPSCRDSEPTTAEEWALKQENYFGHMDKLPLGWIRIKSKNSGKIYHYNQKTGESR